jgi:ABC-type uncharacterized transport system substrate-binding protein
MKRRQFITLLSGSAAAWPLAARAQQPAMPVIGFLSSASPQPFAHLVAAFHRGLNEVDYVEGRNVAIEYRWAENQYDRLPALAAELVRRPVAVIVTSGGDVPTYAAKAATTTIPIVFVAGRDPVESGLVASLNRPGGNATGVTIFSTDLVAKQLGLLREVLPNAAVFGVLINPSNPNAEQQMRAAQEAAVTLGIQLQLAKATSDRDFDTVFATLAEKAAGALLVAGDPFFLSRRYLLVALAARHTVPTMYVTRDFTAAGGLMSYGTDIAGVYRQVGVYTGRILKGAKLSDLPVLLPTTFNLVINLQAAKALGLEIPPMVLARADEVIE